MAFAKGLEAVYAFDHVFAIDSKAAGVGASTSSLLRHTSPSFCTMKLSILSIAAILAFPTGTLAIWENIEQGE